VRRPIFGVRKRVSSSSSPSHKQYQSSSLGFQDSRHASLSAERIPTHLSHLKPPTLLPSPPHHFYSRTHKMGCGASKDAQREAEYQTAVAERKQEEKKEVERLVHFHSSIPRILASRSDRRGLPATMTRTSLLCSISNTLSLGAGGGLEIGLQFTPGIIWCSYELSREPLLTCYFIPPTDEM
jgi:hypothetical protein